MNKEQLEQKRKGVEAQLRWAEIHGGDQELLDLLRCECDRLSVKMGAGCALYPLHVQSDIVECDTL